MPAHATGDDVSRVPSDLHGYRDRLEAGVDQGRKNRETVQELTDQVQRIRKRAAESAGSLPQINVDLPDSEWNERRYPRDDFSGSRYASPRRDRNRNKSLGRLDNVSYIMSPDSLPTRFHSTPRLNVSSEEDSEMEALFARLKSELFKNSTMEEMNEMLREENDAALQANQGLRSDVSSLTTALEALENQTKQDQQRFHSEDTRYRSQLENQHRKLIALWKAFTGVKRQVRDLHTSTANDMDKQKTEFARCAAVMQRAIRQAEQKNRSLEEKNSREKDEVMEDLMKKIEKSSEAAIETEKALQDKSRLVSNLEAQLRRKRDENEDLLNALGRIENMPELGKQKHRTRSASPAGVSSSDVMRRIRSTLATKSREIRELEEKIDKEERENRRLKKEVEGVERDKREKRDAERQRDGLIIEHERTRKDLELEIERLSSRLSLLQEEKESREKVVVSLQENIAEAHRSHKEFIENLAERHRQELESREKLHLTEIEGSKLEHEGKTAKAVQESDRMRVDCDELRQQLRELKAESAVLRKKDDEKDFSILNLEEDIGNLRKQLGDEKTKLDEKEAQMIELEGRNEDQKEREVALRNELIETQNLHSILGDEVKTLQEHTEALKIELEDVREKLDTANSNEDDYQSQLEAQQAAAAEQENHMKSLRQNILDFEIKLESNAEENRIREEQLSNSRALLEQKVGELSETVRQLEEMRREKDLLADDLSASQHDNESLTAKMADLEGDLEKKREEESDLRKHYDDIRMKYDEVNHEKDQNYITIEDLKGQVTELEEKLKKSQEEMQEEKKRTEEKSKEREEELEKIWKEKLERTKEDQKKTESELAATTGRLDDLTKLHEKLMEDELQLRMQLDEAKDSLEESAAKHKKEMEHLSSQNSADREEWEEEREQLEKSKASAVSDLREELSKIEEELNESRAKEQELRDQLDESFARADAAEARAATIAQQIEEKGEDIQLRERQLDDEKRDLLSKLEQAQLEVVKLQSQLGESHRNKQLTEKELSKAEAIMAQKSESLKEFESKMDMLMEKLMANERAEQEFKDQVAMLERENTELQSTKERALNRLAEEQRRVTELDQRLRDTSKEVQNFKVRSQLEEEQRMGKDGKVQTLTNKVRQLELQLADRQAKTDSTSELVRRMEGDGQTLGQDLRKEKERNADLTRLNDELKKSVQALSGELENARGALEKKTVCSRQATAELLNNYKEAEKRFVDMQSECEHLKAHVATLNTKLDRTETKKREAEHRWEEIEARNVDLSRRLHQYERSAKVALNMARSQTSMRPGTSTIDLPRTISSGLGDSHSNLRSAASSHDISFRYSPERSVRFQEDPSNLDISSSMEITLRYLKERIQQLERDKAEITSEAESLREDSRRANDRLKEAGEMLTKLEKRLATLDEENHQLEHRLSSQRQLYLSNEESSRGKDHEHRALKAKIATNEIHLREKESKLAHANAQLDALRVELSSMSCDREKTAKLVKEHENELKQLDDEKNALEAERHRLSGNVRELQNELKDTLKRLSESENEQNRTDRALVDLRRAADRDRQLLDKLQQEERHWRQTAVHAKRSSDDFHKSIYEEKLTALQATHEATLSRNEAYAAEADRLRAELREYSHKVNMLNVKIADLERSTSMEKESKISLSQQLAAFQKVENEWSRMEKEMRDELKHLRKDKLMLTSEVEELRRRLMKSDVERKEIDGFRARLEREVNALKKHLTALEEEKSRTDVAVRETMAERKAIDKSLAAMERENAELYRNCGQLQTQLQQLERDSGQRAMSKMMKDQTALEGRITKLNQEKRQLELMIEQKENNFSHKRKMLESQLSLLREQLEVERRKRPGATFERSSDIRVSRTMALQRHKSPFRADSPNFDMDFLCHEVYSSTYSSRNSSVGFETLI